MHRDTRTWSNQPEWLTDFDVVAEMSVKGSEVEIRKGSDRLYYVTVGNLFMSKTIICVDAVAVFKLLDSIEHRHLKTEGDLPNGCGLALDSVKGTD